MTRRSSQRNLDVTAFDSTAFDQQEVDPMASTANLVDAMLVFACGLMMALVVRYNVDLTNIQDVYIEEDLTRVDNIEQLKDQIESGGSGYTQLGTVYQDPSTGEMYMITDTGVEYDENAAQSNAGSGSGSGSVQAPSRANGAD